MSASPAILPPTPGQIRAALTAHTARKLGWSGRSSSHLLGGLDTDDLCRCAAAAPDEARATVYRRMSDAIGRAVDAPAHAVAKQRVGG